MFGVKNWTKFAAFMLCMGGVATAEEWAGPEVTPAPVVEEQPCYECENDWCSKSPLLGIFQATDTRWSDFISPMTNPVFFEDPRTLTEARFIFLQHNIPALAGGAIPSSNVQLLAMQVRAALTEDLSIIATKDGFIWASPGAPLDDGWADVSVGLKYNLWKDLDSLRILSVGTTYELPVGSRQALQGNGSGEFNLFAAYGAAFGCGNHFLTTAGLRLPSDKVDENQVFYWSGHLDRQINGTRLYGFVEGNWYHWMSNGGNAGLNGIQGGDLFNFGSTGVAGSNIVTGAFGLKFKPTQLQEIGVAYELPCSSTHGVLSNRLTVDYILRY